MKLKYSLLLVIVLAASQAAALTANQRYKGCTEDGTGCGFGDSAGQSPNGGGDYSTYAQAYIIAGSLWETFYDKQGDYDIETNLTTGKKTVHMSDKAAFLIKPPPPNHLMKRSALVYGPLMPAPTLAQAKEAAAKVAGAAAAGAAAQAASQKAAADAAANKAAQQALAVSPGMVLTTQTVGMTNPSIVPRKP